MSENSQDITMDNQQERLTEVELAWLAGIIDGEGAIMIGCNSTHRSIYPNVLVASLSEVMIDECARIIAKMGIEFVVKKKIRTYKNEYRRPYCLIRILTAIRIKTLLEYLKPYLIVKTKHCEIVLEFCNSRISLPYGYPYTERELQLFHEIKKYQMKSNRRSARIPNDYTPGWRPRYKKNTVRNISYRKKRDIILPEDIV